MQCSLLQTIRPARQGRTSPLTQGVIPPPPTALGHSLSQLHQLHVPLLEMLPASTAPLYTGPCWVRPWEPQEAFVGASPWQGGGQQTGCVHGQTPEAYGVGRALREGWPSWASGRPAGWPPSSCHSLQSTRKSGNVLGDRRSRWLRLSCVYNIYEM